MQEQAMYHKPETQYAYALSENSVALRLRTAKEDTPEVSVLYGGKYDFARKRREKAMRLCCSDRLFNYYTAYVFRIRERGKTYYYSEDGLSEHFAFDLSYYNAFQIAYLNAADIHRPVQWMQDARFYQIFIDRFFRGNQEKDDSYITLPWGELPTPKSFAGGDLKGITKKLPYLHELGVNALYLTPVFQSVSNHKYDTQDYFAIDEMFGGEKDFRKFMQTAHEAGFHVVLDAVFNHVSERCLQFRDVLQNGKASRYFDWFLIDGDKVDRQKVNYQCFAACDYMPKWNTSCEEVQHFLIGVALHYMKEYGVDGWRLDVSDEVSHDFWRKFRAAVKAENGACVIIGENWHDANPYLRGDQYDSIMNYAFTKACLDAFAFGTLDASGFAEKVCVRNARCFGLCGKAQRASDAQHRYRQRHDAESVGQPRYAPLFDAGRGRYPKTRMRARRSLSLCRRAVHLLRHGDRHGGRVRPRLPPHDGLGTRGGTAAPLAARAAACRFETGMRRPARDEGKNMGGRRSLLSGARRKKQAAAHRQFRERAAADRKAHSDERGKRPQSIHIYDRKDRGGMI